MLDLLRDGSVPTIAEFDEAVFRTLCRDRPPDGPLAARRAVRRLLAAELVALDLDVSAWTAEGPQPYRLHDALLAGHALVHPRGQRPELPVRDTGRDGHNRAHEARMAGSHGLRPVPGFAAESLSEFSGQADGIWPLPGPFEGNAGRRRPAWWDHARTWADRRGDPVLTIEPYRDAVDPMSVVHGLDGLALDLEVFDGVWNDRCTLLLFRLHPEREPLSSVRSPTPDPLGDDRDELDALTAAVVQAEHVALGKVNKSPPLTRAAISGLVARAIAANGGATCEWAECRLAVGLLAGQLDASTFRTLVARLRERLPLKFVDEQPNLDLILRAAQVRAWRSIFSDGADDVRAILGDDFPRRVYELCDRHPGARGQPRLVLAASWLSELLAAEVA